MVVVVTSPQLISRDAPWTDDTVQLTDLKCTQLERYLLQGISVGVSALGIWICLES